jgi:hypothetical protein
MDKFRYKLKRKQAKSDIPPKSAKPKKKRTKVRCKLAILHMYHAVGIPIETNWFNFYLQPKNNNDVLHRQVDLQNDGSNEDEKSGVIKLQCPCNFTQLITAPNCGEENLQF